MAYNTSVNKTETIESITPTELSDLFTHFRDNWHDPDTGKFFVGFAYSHEDSELQVILRHEEVDDSVPPADEKANYDNLFGNAPVGFENVPDHVEVNNPGRGR